MHDFHENRLIYAYLSTWVEDVLQFVTTLGHGTCLIKVDLRSAIQNCACSSTRSSAVGRPLGGQVYVDLALPFGLRSAPKLFTAVADALGWALLLAGAPPHIHYLDDYLFFLPPGSPSTPMALQHITGVLDRLGVPVSTQKIEGPSPVVTFLGVIVDTNRYELRLPAAKLDHIR